MNDAPATIAALEPIMNDADFDATLTLLRDSLADAGTLCSIILALRANAAKLKEPLASSLHEAEDAIRAALLVLELRP